MVRKLVLRIQMNEPIPSDSSSDSGSDSDSDSDAVEDLIDGFKAEIESLVPAIGGVQSQIESIARRIEEKQVDPFLRPNRVVTTGAEAWCKKYGVEETPSVQQFVWALLRQCATSTDMSQRTLRISTVDATLLGFDGSTVTIFDVMRRIPELLEPICP